MLEDQEPGGGDGVRKVSPSKRRWWTSRASARSRHALHAVRRARREGGEAVAKIWSTMCGKASCASGADAADAAGVGTMIAAVEDKTAQGRDEEMPQVSRDERSVKRKSGTRGDQVGRGGQ